MKEVAGVLCARPPLYPGSALVGSVDIHGLFQDLSFDFLRGFQLAGLFDFTRGEVVGLQLSGLFNLGAARVHRQIARPSTDRAPNPQERRADATSLP